MPLTTFHPAVADWFEQQFKRPTQAQTLAWPAIQAKQATLISAPTGSGKTLAAFLAAINDLICLGIAGELADQTQVLYISPLKALSNDIQKNLQQPLNGIRDKLLENGFADVNIEAMVRTGDTSQAERSRMRRKAPHILVTTPESLYILLSSESGRGILANVRSVIIDEIHALAGNKRGSHLMLSLERLNALCQTHQNRLPVRIGLSATQKPLEQMAQFLVGNADSKAHSPCAVVPCTIVDTGHVRQRDLALEVPPSPLEAVMANEVWDEIYVRLEQLINEHTTTLIFVNTRRLAERAAHHLAERIGEDNVTSHHGSLAKEHRLEAEQRLKAGKLRALVATASLELGIDIGDIDLVCQLGSPRAISAFLQRVGRSGHAVGALPKGRLFPLTRDDLVECSAMLEAIRANELDKIIIPYAPLDVLAQQIVAEVASREWPEKDLYQMLIQAWPYRNLAEQDFIDVVQMLADGFSTRRGRRSAYLHRDVINGRLRARRGARLTAVTNGGAIPDQFDYDVILQPEGYSIGNLNEDFAFESLPGDIFQLGNNSYRMLKIEQGRVFVEDAHGQPPNIPFWFGEAPGRSNELSKAVSDFRQNMDQHLEQGKDATLHWLQQELKLSSAAATQVYEYLATAKAALGHIPTQQRIMFERFFDETGDMHFIIHSPYGSRVNRAWGLSLRKRFCRKFNFELQAAATEDNVILSLGPTHSFPLDEVANYLNSNTVRQLLTQALLDAPMFATRWRWSTNIALAVPRFRNGKKIPAQFQRNNAEDLVAVIFPDQLACLENIAGDREVPRHPLVKQTIDDCLNDLMDIGGLENILDGIKKDEIEIITHDLTSPSPLAQEILNANPYAFLDDAPAEERRTLAVQQRRYSLDHNDPNSAADLGRLDPDAILKVREEIWPDPRNADELHDSLVILGFLSESEIQPDWQDYLSELQKQQRITLLIINENNKLWIAAERLFEMQLIFPDNTYSDNTSFENISTLDSNNHTELNKDSALIEIIRSRTEGLGPVTAQQLAMPLNLNTNIINSALLALEQEGFVIQGQFETNVLTPAPTETQWCERRILARIHRYTLKRLRSEIEPVSPSVFMRFLFHWHGLDEKRDGQDALADILTQLEGLALPASAWEKEILPARMDLYISQWLDNLCNSGRFHWARLNPPVKQDSGNSTVKHSTPVSNTPISIILRQHIQHWLIPNKTPNKTTQNLTNQTRSVFQLLQNNGALFFDDLVTRSNLLRTQTENALGELVAKGYVTADGFVGLRALITPSHKKSPFQKSIRTNRPRKRTTLSTVEDAGRWSLLSNYVQNSTKEAQLSTSTSHTLPFQSATVIPTLTIEHIARVLLKRYGVVFRKILERESNLPSWRDLLYVYRRLEARGEIRGGRFVTGFSGEQFALPEALASLRNVRNQATQGELTIISAVDPLNLTGVITAGKRVSAKINNRILYQDGRPVAVNLAGEISLLIKIPQEQEWMLRNALLRNSTLTNISNHNNLAKES